MVVLGLGSVRVKNATKVVINRAEKYPGYMGSPTTQREVTLTLKPAHSLPCYQFPSICIHQQKFSKRFIHFYYFYYGRLYLRGRIIHLDEVGQTFVVRLDMNL